MSMSVLIRILLIIALIVVIVVMQMKKRRAKEAAEARFRPAGSLEKTVGGTPRPRAPKVERPPEEVFMGVRKQAFSAGPERVGPGGAVGEGQAYGSIMEMGLTNSVVTLVCFANGDASIYYKTGGGMVGGGGHETVRKAAKQFLERTQAALPLMVPTPGYPLPEDGRVHFYALTPTGVVGTARDRETLGAHLGEGEGAPDAALTTLFAGGQEVVSQMRQIQEQRAG